MIINFLGTGTSQGIPIIGSNHPVCLSKDPKDKRLRSSIMIEINKKYFLIDCSPDFRYQMILCKYKFIDAILLTHEHNDHTSGLDDIKQINNIINKSIPVYGLSRVLDEIKNRFYYFFLEKKYPGTSRIDLIKIENNKKIIIQGINIITLSIMHGKLPILGYRIKNFAYITDASFIPEKTLKLLKGVTVLVLNTLRKNPKHHSHFILKEALEIIDIIKPNKTYLTHISHLLGFHYNISKELPKNIYLAYDGLKLKI